MTVPLSVLLPVHNAEAFLREAIDSILAQRFRDFELIVIDDGSRDGSATLLRRVTDARVTIKTLPDSLGIAEALNAGIEAAHGRYLARMDADDVAAPDRFQRQFAYLEQHPRVAVVGSRIHYIGRNVPSQDFRPLDAASCRAYLLFGTPLVHPSVMLRRDVLTHHGLRYEARFSRSEDYRLWTRVQAHGDLCNLPEALLGYRVHAASVTGQHGGVMQSEAGEIQRELVQHYLGRAITDAEAEAHAAIASQVGCRSWDGLERMRAWLRILRQANADTHAYEAEGLERALAIAAFHVCRNSAALGIAGWRAGRPLWRAARPPARLRLRHFLAAWLYTLGVLRGGAG